MGRAFSLLLIVGCVAGAFYGANWVLTDPKTPLPRQWNPVQPLLVSDPITPVTRLKLANTLASDQACLSVLATAQVQATARPDLVDSQVCHIKGRTTLGGLGEVRVRPVETRCETALRMAMWVEHGLQPAARNIFGQPLGTIDHFSSYNCRAIRTTQGDTNKMSTHATADAIDISGFRLADGQRISLLKDWDGSSENQTFLRAARDTACTWFGTTLGPDYNRLHRDHFHLQNTGRGTCR
jgi:hypothetical protein